MESMFEQTPSKKTQETDYLNGSKCGEPTSFIIISPCLGYKIKFNKRASILYIGHKPVIHHYNEEIKANFVNSEVFLVSGEYTGVYKAIQDGFGIIENQLYLVTGECEQLRLGIQACSNKRIVVLKEKSFVNINSLVDKIEQFVYITEEYDGPGCIIHDGVVENISYAIDSNRFSDCFMMKDQTITNVYNYVSQEQNKSKMIFEVINKFIDTGFKAVT